MKKQKIKIKIEKLTVDVFFTYHPEESIVMYDSDGGGYPGADAYVDDISVYTDIHGHQIEITDVLIGLGYSLEDIVSEEIGIL